MVLRSSSTIYTEKKDKDDLLGLSTRTGLPDDKREMFQKSSINNLYICRHQFMSFILPWDTVPVFLSFSLLQFYFISIPHQQLLG